MSFPAVALTIALAVLALAALIFINKFHEQLDKTWVWLKPKKVVLLPTNQYTNVRTYRPVDSSLFVSNELQTVVHRGSGPNNDHFKVDFQIPPLPPPLPGQPQMTDFPQIAVTIAHQPQTLGQYVPLQSVASPVAPILGHWRVGDKVTFEFDLPKQFTDPSQGWIVKFCVGQADNCIPSPNLLVGVPD
jgi:hypothetical protein